MKAIRINDYCFNRVHLWVQYHWQVPQFVEVVVELFYPRNRKANGLVMFNHGFLIGNDLLYYPKKFIGSFFGDNPLYGIDPSDYYNYSEAIVEKNWAMAFLSTCHTQVEGVPWTDIGGNPRVGQEAYAAASYLIKYGMTDDFFKEEKAGRNSKFFDAQLAGSSRFMVSNNVIFAGHSVGGAHAQAAACGFETLQEEGRKSYRLFDPVIYDREVLPTWSERMSKWSASDRANPVGLVMLSPVDQKMPLIMPGMAPYREALVTRQMPMAMVVGQCDCATLEQSNPPAWSDDATKTSQFTQLSPAAKGSWATVAMVERGSHCGYLTDTSDLCSAADMKILCKRCPGVTTYKPKQEQRTFTSELFKRFIDLYPNGGSFQGGFDEWAQSGFMSWLNQKSPDDSKVNLVPFPSGRYADLNAPQA